MIYHTPRQVGKTITQKLYTISNKLAQHNPITLLEAWNFVLEYWRDNYGKELTYELVEEEYRKKEIMNRVGARWLSITLAREQYNKLGKGGDK